MKDLIKTKKKKYKVVLKVLGKRWESKGETLLEALQDLKLTWEQIKGKGTLNIYVNGKKKHEHLFTMVIIRRILSNKIIKTHWAKSLEFLIQEDKK